MKLFLHIALWTLAFFNGVIRLLEFEVGIVRVGIPLIILLLFFIQLFSSLNKWPYYNLYILLLAVIIFSGLLNGISNFQILNFVTYLFIPLLYLIIIINEKDIKLLETIKNYIVFLYILQIPASLVKFMLVGQSEEYIGTISVSEGSLSAVIPMIASSYLFSKYLYTNEKKYLFIIVLYILFGLIGEKRAIVFFIPALLFVIYALFLVKEKIKFTKIFAQLAKISVLSILFLYIMVRLNPTLTPEGEIGGSFDPEYVMDYTENYNALEGKSTNSMSRFSGLMYFGFYLYNQSSSNFLIGEGSGKLLMTDKNPMLYHYGIRYAGRMGVIWLYLQIGIIGAMLFLVLFFKLLIHVLKLKNIGFHSLVFSGIWMSIFIDIAIYSISSLHYFAIIGTLYFYYAYINKTNESSQKMFLRKVLPNKKKYVRNEVSVY